MHVYIITRNKNTGLDKNLEMFRVYDINNYHSCFEDFEDISCCALNVDNFSSNFINAF